MRKKRIAFIGCSKTKAPRKVKAKELYLGALFKKALIYCTKTFDEVYILSAKYGLLSLDQIIEPYDITLNDFSIEQKKEWAEKVKKQMIDKNLNNHVLFFFCGKNYHQFFEGNKPLENLSLGNQLKYFNQVNKRKGFFS